MTKSHPDYYRMGIRRLLEEVGPNHPSYADLLTLQQRLEENLEDTERFGADPSLQANRARILDSCNRLSLSVTGRSFYHFCGLPDLSLPPEERARELFSEATCRHLTGDLGYALQLYRQARELDPGYPRIDATIAAVEQEMQAPYVDRYGLVSESDAMTSTRPRAKMRRPQAKMRDRYIEGRQGRIIGYTITAIVIVALLILLYLWLRGMIG